VIANLSDFGQHRGNSIGGFVLDSAHSLADSAPAQARQKAAASPKRIRRRLLTKVDRRNRVGRRIDELKALFLAALADREQTPMLVHKVGQAAELLAMAEKGRGDYLRGEHCQLDDVVRAERRAEAAVAALGIREPVKKTPTLAEYLASKAAE
jgi:hypothetical protein